MSDQPHKPGDLWGKGVFRLRITEVATYGTDTFLAFVDQDGYRGGGSTQFLRAEGFRRIACAPAETA